MCKKWWIVARGWRIFKMRAIVWTWPVTSLEKPRGEHNEKRGYRMWNRGSSLSASLSRSWFSLLVGNSIITTARYYEAWTSFVHIMSNTSHNLFKYFFERFRDLRFTICIHVFASSHDFFSWFFSWFLLWCLLRKNVIFCVDNRKLKYLAIYYIDRK